MNDTLRLTQGKRTLDCGYMYGFQLTAVASAFQYRFCNIFISALSSLFHFHASIVERAKSLKPILDNSELME
jgi:hypothetical protein